MLVVSFRSFQETFIKIYAMVIFLEADEKLQ